MVQGPLTFSDVKLHSTIAGRLSLAGPNAAKIRRPIWRSDRQPKIWTAKLAGKIIDGQPALKRPATFAVRQDQRQKISAKNFKYYIEISNH
ncbi:hypothetical protein BpHYR1_043098 [Brachionus plicatilis]|uniref:Uncharacterized protein n=1 Tax=Brachionus plicatilis TaxID=10195 RepID=A0A3M7T1Y6_BRAPC|nr:hypothetical protein BpHYR1_043098 [Brachionus plicatilis]